MHEVAEAEGIFTCPEGGSLYAAVKKLKQKGFVSAEDKIILLNTGAGIIYPDTIQDEIPYTELDATL